MQERDLLAYAHTLVVEGAAVSRGGRRIVAGVDLRLAPGDALQLVGRNGAGKSTLLRALAGLLPLAAGRLTVAKPGGEACPLAEAVHYLGHAEGLKGALTAGENLGLAAALAGGAGTAPDLALDRLGIGHLVDLPVAYCSAGQRRRVGLGRLLVAGRPLWLLDEPTTALDAAGQGLLATLLAEHRSRGGIVVAATHGPAGLAAPLATLELGS